MNKNLDTILEKIMIDSTDNFNFEKFEQQIQKELPGYDITTFDMDNPDSDMFSIARAISTRVKGKTVEDIRYSDWYTQDEQLSVFVLAIKTK